MEQEITTIVLNYESDIKKADANRINALADALEKLDKVNVDDSKAIQLKNIGDALSGFKTFRIGKGFTEGIDTVVNTINGLETVKDITPFADNLVNGFNAISKATEGFQTKTGAKIPVNLGAGITGVVESINKIDQIKDLTPVAETLNNSFETIAIAVSHFHGMDLSKIKNIDNIVAAFNNLGEIKPIDSTIIKNAEMLAKAINVLDKNVKGSDTRLKALGSATRAVSRDFDKGAKSVDRFNKSISVMKIAGTIWAIQKVSRTMQGLISSVYGFVDAFGDVQNTLSFFGASLEGEAGRVANVIQQYADAGIVDFTQFADQVAKLNQMYKGYGIGAEDAATMALSMTQLAYDASYALGQNGKDIDLWMNRITSMSTGQVRSGYYLGLDLSVQALSESFEGLTNNADKATKVTAMYEEVMRQTVAIQGQMVNEIENTYVRVEILKNRFNHLKQSIGQALVPAFEWLIEVAMIALKVIERLIAYIARLFGGDFKMLNYEDMINNMTGGMAGGMNEVANSANDVASGIGNANKQAKELKKTIQGIDQVFTINDMVNEPTGGAGSGGIGSGGIDGGVGGYDWLKDLSESANVKFLENINEQVDQVMDTFEKWIPIISTIAALMLGIKFSTKFMDSLKWISGMKDIFGGLGLDKLTFGVGLLLLTEDLWKFKDAIEKLLQGDYSMTNFIDMVTSFTGIIGDLLIITGNWKLGSLLKVFQGAGEIINAIRDMSENGINWSNVKKMLDGVSNVLVGIGMWQAIVNKNPKILGISLFMKGIIGIIDQASAIMEAISTGDWSGVNKAKLFTDALMAIAGFLLIFKKFKDVADKSGGMEVINKTPEVIQNVDKGIGESSNKMKDLAKNLAWGIVVMAEIVAIAVIFVAGIWAIGLLLQQVIEAWTPVLADGDVALISLGLGTALLAAVGLAAYALGTMGGTLVTQLALGGAVLLLVEAEALLFVGYIWGVGLLLGEIVEAWKPVLNDGDTAAKAIGLGTALLIAIGVVAAALGVASVATAGLLPAAIALGSVMLIALAAEALIFVRYVRDVGISINEINTAWSPVLNSGKTTENAIKTATALLIGIGVVSAALGVASVASVGLLPLAIGLGSKMLVELTTATKTFVTEIGLLADAMVNDLHPPLVRLNEVLPTLSMNMENYVEYMTIFAGHTVSLTASNAVSGLSGTIDTIIGWFTKDPIQKMGEDVKKNGGQFETLVSNLNYANPLAKKGADGLDKYAGLLNELKRSADRASSVGTMPNIGIDFKDFSKALKEGFADLENVKTSNVANIMKALSSLDLNKFRGMGTDIVKAMELGINNYNFNLRTATDKIKKSLTFDTTSIGSKMAEQVVSGINRSSANASSFTNKIKSSMTVNMTSVGSQMGRQVVSGINGSSVSLGSFTSKIRSNLNTNTYYIGLDIARGVVNGINGYYPNVTPFTNSLKNAMKRSFNIHSPSRWARDVIGAMIGEGTEIGINDTDVDVNPFKRSIEDELNGFDIQPMVNMPTFDTTNFYKNMDRDAMLVTSQVQSKYDVDNDKTNKSIDDMKVTLLDALLDLIDAVDEKETGINASDIVKVAEEGIKNNIVRNNKA